MAAFWIAFGLCRSFQTYIEQLSLIFLTAAQVLRILGLTVLVLWGYGLVPGGFGIPMSVLDASVGVIAIYVVWLMYKRQSNWRTSAILLHSWGFLDFIVTISLAIFAWSSLSIDPPVAKGGYVSLALPPLSLFPSFAIPFFSCLHFAAWINLMKNKGDPT